MSTQLSVDSGTLDLTILQRPARLSTGDGTSSVTITGTQAQINADAVRICSVTLPGQRGWFNGNDTLTVLSTDGTTEARP